MRKITIFGKTLSVALLALLLIGVASAGLLTIYGRIIGTAYIEQSVILSGDGCDGNECTYTMESSPGYGGSIYVHNVTIENRANQQVPIKFVTTALKCAGAGYATCPDPANDVITTRYYGMLKLENKNTGTWEAISDGIEATLKYDLVSSTFDYELEATGLTPSINYVLIYYADRQDRFVNWGGDNPGALIATIMTDGSGNIDATGSFDLAMNLPHGNDWNLDPNPDYCLGHNNYDSYNLCGGAKIWLVPETEYTSGTKKVTWANPSSYLYETDMIDYSDKNIDGSKFWMNNGKIQLYIENTFNPATETGYYKVTTEAQPA